MNKGNRTLKPLLLAAPLWLPFNASAEELLSEQSFFDNIPTMIAGTRLEQKQREIPAAVTLIDRQMIESSGAINIADLLRLVPGFQAYHLSANKHAVVNHGQGELHPGRLEVMIDGRSVYSAVVSTVDWRALGITIEDIERIEVVRGPSVVTHGSNAFLGAINIITRNPLSATGLQLRLLAGDLNTREYGLEGTIELGHLSLRLSTNFMSNEGTGVGSEDDPLTGERDLYPIRIADGGEISQLSVRGLYTPSLSDTVDFHLGGSQGQFGMGNILHPVEITDREVDSHFQNITWTRTLDDGNQLKLQGYHNYTRYNQDLRRTAAYLLADELDNAALLGLTTIPLVPGLTDAVAGEDAQQLVNLDGEEGATHRYDLEMEYSGRLNQQTRAIVGAGWRLDRIKSVPQLNRASYVSEPLYRTFGNLEWRPNESWTFNGGAMFEYNNMVGGRLSPRAGANWHLNRYVTLRSNVVQAYRTPSVLDWHQFEKTVLPSNGAVLDVTSATFNELKPEKIRSADLGILLHQPALRSTFDLRLFFEDIDDALADQERNLSEFGLTEVAGDQVFVNSNTAEWRNRGIDLQWQLQPTDTSRLHLAYSYLTTDGSFDRGLDTDIDQPNTLAPRHTLALLASQKLPANWAVSGAVYRISQAKYFRGDIIDYTRADLRLAKTLPLGEREARFELIAQNVLNDAYLEFERNNLFERRWFLRFVLETQ